jgi:hypothetical protein
MGKHGKSREIGNQWQWFRLKAKKNDLFTGLLLD